MSVGVGVSEAVGVGGGVGDWATSILGVGVAGGGELAAPLVGLLTGVSSMASWRVDSVAIGVGNSSWGRLARPWSGSGK